MGTLFGYAHTQIGKGIHGVHKRGEDQESKIKVRQKIPCNGHVTFFTNCVYRRSAGGDLTGFVSLIELLHVVGVLDFGRCLKKRIVVFVRGLLMTTLPGSGTTAC